MARTDESVSDIEHELRERRAELARAEERILGKEQSLDVRLAELERRERSLDDRGRNLEHQSEELKRARQRQLKELERIAGLTADEAVSRAVDHLGGGTATKVEGETEHGRAVWEVDVRRDSRITEVQVDTATGSVTRVDDDGRDDRGRDDQVGDDRGGDDRGGDDRGGDDRGRHGGDHGPGHS